MVDTEKAKQAMQKAITETEKAKEVLTEISQRLVYPKVVRGTPFVNSIFLKKFV